MSKTSDLAAIFTDLRKNLKSALDAIDSLEEILSNTEDPVPEAVPEPPKQFKLEDVRAVLAEVSRNGHTADVKELLQKFGANKLSEVKPEDYTELMMAAEALQ